ncbi:MAG: hypothetical protein EWV92_10555 [Microcystis aeruginosa Ma_MB_S_20031200_S102]|uniref:Uncharacterized protein n=1 Tax=Microcystis aeruginosa Ma_MB_S_20031200_S102 TaxID=2486254 RepID=A0A552ESK1_MICAE|nr:MAG: hypothetical protein EWV79_08665 [Microcystis aeruginosa Ma_MB_S_20031200_S102D]TRU37438.1 MAG: hypothetical protein EWV92_10555 [Microcystis aeruginosa Ma_MB_S_20031200_S102]
MGVGSLIEFYFKLIICITVTEEPIILRIEERFNPRNVSSETTSHSLTDDLSDLDPWTRDLVGVVDLGPEDPKESYIDYLVEKYR